MNKITATLMAFTLSSAVTAGGHDTNTSNLPSAEAQPTYTLYFGLHADMTQDFWQQKNLSAATYLKATSAMHNPQGGFQTGIQFNAVRAEVAMNYGTYRQFGGPVPHFDAFLKTAYDLTIGHGLQLYPVAGIGLLHTFAHSVFTTSVKSASHFAWLLGAGVTLQINSKTRLSGEYNWVNNTQSAWQAVDSSSGTTYNIKNSGQNVMSFRCNRTF